MPIQITCMHRSFGIIGIPIPFAEVYRIDESKCKWPALHMMLFSEIGYTDIVIYSLNSEPAPLLFHMFSAYHFIGQGMKQMTYRRREVCAVACIGVNIQLKRL